MNLLIETMDHLGIPYNDKMLQQFQGYMDGILEWNEKVNLTAITEPADFVQKHYVDSILCAPYTPFSEAEKIIDVGTGAGFPGIPLAILFPDKEFVLMDSLNKRLKIIHELSQGLGIYNVSLCHGRAEDLGQMKRHREQYDLCVSRAVANLAVLSEYCLPFVKVGGWFAAYKSLEAEQEIEESKKAIKILGGELMENKNLSLPGYELNHSIVFIKKEKKTLAKYPRKAGTPVKEPLK